MRFRQRSIRRPGGFTLIEASMTTAIIGIAFVAALELYTACTRQNRASAQITTAMLLARHVQEAMLSLPFTDPNPLSAKFGAESGETLATFDDIDDFHNQSFNPPIDAMRRPINELSNYTQTVTVTNVNPNQPSAAGSAGSAVRITVTITFQSSEIAPVERVCSYSWLRMNQ